MVALPASRGPLVAVSGASTPGKDEFVAAFVETLAERGRPALVIGNRRTPAPEADEDTLRLVSGQGLDDALAVSRMAECSALSISPTVLTVRSAFDELARYRAARRLRAEYIPHYRTRQIEEAVSAAAAGYDVVLWIQSPFGSASLDAFDNALGTVLVDLGVEHLVLTPPVPTEMIIRLVRILPPLPADSSRKGLVHAGDRGASS